jgi:signal transduction histidine kinase
LGATISNVLFFCFFLLKRKNTAKVLYLEEQIRQLEVTRKKELFEATLKAQEEERLRIGQNLHDDLGNLLASLKLTIDMLLYEYLDQAAFDVFKATCKMFIDEIISNIRRVSHNLSPASLELYGLQAAVEDMVETFNKTRILEISLQNEAGEALNNIQQSTALSLFRVLEELLTNTIKHAQAKKVLISFSSGSHSLIILYKDDGKGMESIKSNGMGLINIKNRLHFINASYVITTAPGEGFIMEITVNRL